MATVSGRLVLTALLACSVGAHAQIVTTSGAPSGDRRAVPNERTLGLMLGVHTIGASGIGISMPSFEAPFQSRFGVGPGVMAGYGFNRIISGYASLDVARQLKTPDGSVQGSYGLRHAEVGVRVNFADFALGGGNTLPYLLGSVGRRVLSARMTDPEGESERTAELTFHGRVFGVGAGFEHFISPNMSIDAGLHLGFGNFDRVRLDVIEGPVPAGRKTSRRLRLGVTWRPSTRNSLVAVQTRRTDD